MRRALALALALPLGLAAAAPAPAPERGAWVLVDPVSGDVQVRPAGAQRYRDLDAAQRLPVGVTVDAQEGAARLTVEEADGGTATAVFSRGKFTVSQPRRGEDVTTLRLTGPSHAEVCGTEASAAAARGGRKVRRLWGDGKGSFRTRGRYSAATVRGTRWLVEDRCDGTVTRVARGTVQVEDFTAEPPPAPPPPPAPDPGPAPAPPASGDADESTVIVAAGGRYVARP